MKTSDGFIEGIFNYCDRWCERCEFTSWCREFADGARIEASCDPGFKALIDAPPLPEEIPPPPPRWLQEMIDEMNRVAGEPLSAAELARFEPRLAPEHEPILGRAHQYCFRVHGWLRSRVFGDEPASDPRAVVAWFHTLIPAKIDRALRGFARDVWNDPEWPADHDGSAKVALLGIEQSQAAWRQLAERGLAHPVDVESMIADLVWLGEELERVFPGARAFVRPAFDEPDEVARLLALEERR